MKIEASNLTLHTISIPFADVHNYMENITGDEIDKYWISTNDAEVVMLQLLKQQNYDMSEFCLDHIISSSEVGNTFIIKILLNKKHS